MEGTYYPIGSSNPDHIEIDFTDPYLLHWWELGSQTYHHQLYPVYEDKGLLNTGTDTLNMFTVEIKKLP
jgi:hypothetical protein